MLFTWMYNSRMGPHVPHKYGFLQKSEIRNVQAFLRLTYGVEVRTILKTNLRISF